MSAKHVYLLKCDGEFCTETLPTGEALVGDARAEAERAGWSLTFTPGDNLARDPRARYGWARDFCARCTADLKAGAA